MASINNQYLLAGTPFKQYVKTVPSKIAGTRLDPTQAEMRPVGFVIETDPDSPAFDEETEIVAVYSEREDLFFQQANRALFRLGMLKAYTAGANESKAEVELTLSDEEVRAVAAIRTAAQLRERLATITSYFALSRIVKAAEEMGAKKTYLDIMRARQTELAP